MEYFKIWNFVLNFKGILWNNSTQDILPAHWKTCNVLRSENVNALRFASPVREQWGNIYATRYASFMSYMFHSLYDHWIVSDHTCHIIATFRTKYPWIQNVITSRNIDVWTCWMLTLVDHHLCWVNICQVSDAGQCVTGCYIYHACPSANRWFLHGYGKIIALNMCQSLINVHGLFEFLNQWNDCIAFCAWHHEAATVASVTWQWGTHSNQK